MDATCSIAYGRENWHVTKDDCDKKCDKECSPCKLMGSTDMHYACLQTPSDRSQTVFGFLKGGSHPEIISIEKTQK